MAIARPESIMLRNCDRFIKAKSSFGGLVLRDLMTQAALFGGGFYRNGFYRKKYNWPRQLTNCFVIIQDYRRYFSEIR
jgi:hypothetical protein